MIGYKNDPKWQPTQLKNKMVIYSVPPENKELRPLIEQDIVLRSIIIKTENFNIIIEQSKRELFTNRMKELGYLV